MSDWLTSLVTKRCIINRRTLVGPSRKRALSLIEVVFRLHLRAYLSRRKMHEHEATWAKKGRTRGVSC